MKFLVGISPAGVISFVSDAWGGKTSDRQIVIDSGLLELLESGDNVMTDKGFTIKDLLRDKGCTLNIPRLILRVSFHFKKYSIHKVLHSC